MSKILASVVLTVVLTPAVLALPTSFTPALPESDEQIEIRFSGVCPTVCSVAQATPSIAGRVITIAVTVQAGVLQAVTAWEGSVRLGPLAPASYLVRVVIVNSSPPKTHDERELIVTESNPPFRVRPFAAQSGEVVTLIADRSRVSLANCTMAGCTPAEVRINGVPATDAQSTSFDVVHVRVPALTPGLYDVTASLGGRDTRVEAALRVFDQAAPDDPLFERILVPLTYQGRGSFGSDWRTDVYVRNVSLHRIPLLGLGDLETGATRNLAPLWPNDDGGVFLRVDRASASSAPLAAFVRDVSRDDTRWGVELPVVRENELRRGRIDFSVVPLDRRFRAMLRLYALDIARGFYFVTITNGQNETLFPLSLTAVRGDPTRPAYASLSLTALGIEDQVVSVAVYPASLSEEARFARFWAFVSVTNNETQHVTLISPQ